MTFQIFTCGRRGQQPAELCCVCRSEPAISTCAFRLRGAKTGQVCGKKLCGRCARPRDGVDLCPPHDRLQGDKG